MTSKLLPEVERLLGSRAEGGDSFNQLLNGVWSERDGAMDGIHPEADDLEGLTMLLLIIAPRTTNPNLFSQVHTKLGRNRTRGPSRLRGEALAIKAMSVECGGWWR